MNEFTVKTLVAVLGSSLSMLMGGWSQSMVALSLLVIADYVSGVIAAAASGQLASRTGLIGIARKVFIFVIIAIAHQADQLLGNQSFVRDASIYFYLANEILSVIENAGKLGVPIPTGLKKAVAIFQSKGGDSNE